LGPEQFCNCPGLTNATIGTSVTRINVNDFYQCNRLVAITVDTNNPVYSSVAGVLFDKSQTKLILCPGGKAGSYTVPGSVTSIGSWAFYECYSLTNITVLNNVTNIATGAIFLCNSLMAITVDMNNAFYSSVAGVLFDKSQITLIQYPGGKVGSYTIPNSVTNIGGDAFIGCASLTSVTIPNSVTNIGVLAFIGCTNLTSVFFRGNAPSVGSSAFSGDTAAAYYLPGTTGWGAKIGGLPTKLWNPLVQTSGASFGVRTNRFGFTLTGSSNLVVVVEACTNLSNPVWQPVQTNTLNTFVGTNGTAYFSDPQWTNYPGRFYRLRSPF